MKYVRGVGRRVLREQALLIWIKNQQGCRKGRYWNLGNAMCAQLLLPAVMRCSARTTDYPELDSPCTLDQYEDMRGQGDTWDTPHTWRILGSFVTIGAVQWDLLRPGHPVSSSYNLQFSLCERQCGAIEWFDLTLSIVLSTVSIWWWWSIAGVALSACPLQYVSWSST